MVPCVHFWICCSYCYDFACMLPYETGRKVFSVTSSSAVGIKAHWSLGLFPQFLRRASAGLTCFPRTFGRLHGLPNHMGLCGKVLNYVFGFFTRPEMIYILCLFLWRLSKVCFSRRLSILSTHSDVLDVVVHHSLSCGRRSASVTVPICSYLKRWRVPAPPPPVVVWITPKLSQLHYPFSEPSCDSDDHSHCMFTVHRIVFITLSFELFYLNWYSFSNTLKRVTSALISPLLFLPFVATKFFSQHDDCHYNQQVWGVIGIFTSIKVKTIFHFHCELLLTVAFEKYVSSFTTILNFSSYLFVLFVDSHSAWLQPLKSGDVCHIRA